MVFRIRKLRAVAIFLIALSVAFVGGYWLMFGAAGSQSHPDDPHFIVRSVSSQPFFEGERVIVSATIMNIEPEREIAIPTTTELAVTPAPDKSATGIASTDTTVDTAIVTGTSGGSPTTIAIPTTIIRRISATGSHAVTARLSGKGVDVLREINVTLASNESKALSFDFGPVPAGDYQVTVTAPSYNRSTEIAAVTVNAAPALDDWTVTGDVAFMLVNLRHDTVDVGIRNDGQHTVIFGDGQYAIFVNTSDSFGVALQGLNQTVVRPGQNVTVRATIPAAGGYYLDYFAIKVPGRAVPVKIPVKAWMSPAA